MIRGKSFKLFVISTIITHSETVIRIEPPRKEAAPSKAYLHITVVVQTKGQCVNDKLRYI